MKVLKSAIASFIATIVLSATGIALAADGDAVETPNAPAVVTIDTRAGDDVNDVEGGTEGNSDPASNPQPSDAPTSTPTPEDTWGECSSFENADGSLVQRCTGEDADGNPVAKSSVELPEDKSPSSAPNVDSAPHVQIQNSPASPSRNAQSLSRPVTNGVANAVVTADNPEVEKPNLPITGTDKKPTVTVNVNKDTKGSSQNAAGAVLETENPLIAASSRASLFTMVACAMFVVVGAGSVVSVRRLKH